MKRVAFVFGILLFAPSVFAQPADTAYEAKWVLYAAFQPGSINPPLQRHTGTQTPLTGIAYIDSINIANGCGFQPDAAWQQRVAAFKKTDTLLPC